MKLTDDTMGANWICVSVLIFLVSPFLSADGLLTATAGSQYRGKFIGRLTQRKHGVSGEVYAVDARTLHLRHFTYDGLGPDAFFWTGFNPEGPNPNGIIVPDERGTKEVLKGYNGQDITISLPDGLTLRDIKWFGVWCRAYEVNFADIFIPANLDFPQPHVIGSLVGNQYGVSSGPIVVVDAQTILVPDFTYDGQAPDLHFWVGRGKPGPDGIRVHDETGGDAPLVKADKKTMVLSLPGDITIFDIDYFGVWCRLYGIDFGHVRVPLNLNVPPSLRMLGVTPQTKLNCEILHDESALEVRWAVVGSGETIVFQMVGRIDSNNYMAFGLSGENDHSTMIGGDATVGWFDEPTGRGYVVDYFLDGKFPCNGNKGVCPDAKLQTGTGLNNVRLLSAAVVNGFTILTWQRRLSANDDLDKSILTNGSQPVIWAVGPLSNQEAAYHTLRNKDDIFIDFGRVPKWNCPAPEPENGISSSTSNPSPSSPIAHVLEGHSHSQTRPGQQNSQNVQSPFADSAPAATQQIAYVYKNFSSSWNVPPIQCHEPEDGVFYAQIGPTGGKRGFNATTGYPSPQTNAWYINGLLLPEIYVVRHKAYTFVVEGGKNADIPSKYHPFYITDDPEGGYQLKSELQKKAVRVFAGVSHDERGNSIPTTTGRLCQWIENDKQPAESFTSYGAYQRSLSLRCDEGQPGILQFSPDENTPNLVYYQSFSAKYQGWKIHVMDKCDKERDGVRTKEFVEKPTTAKSVSQRDQDIGESIQQGTNVSFPTINGIKDVVKEDQTGGSQHLVDYLFVGEKPKLATPPDVPDAGHLRPKLPEISPLAVQPQSPAPQGLPLRQEIHLPIQPETIALPQPPFHQVPPDLVGGARMPQQVYAPIQQTTYTIPMQQSVGGQPGPPAITKIQRNPTYTILDAYGRRVGETSDPAVIYDNRPVPQEYSLLPPRPSQQQQSILQQTQQIVYDQIPQGTVFYASTIAPPQQQFSSAPLPFQYDTRPKVEFSTVLGRIPAEMSHRQGSHVIAIQNAPARRPQQQQPQEQLSLSSENVRYIEYPPVHLRLPQPPASWPRSRNLPKRENLPEQRRPALFINNRDQLRMSLKRSGSPGADPDIRNENILRDFRRNDAGQVLVSDFPAEVYRRMPQRNHPHINPNPSTEQSGQYSTINNTTLREATPAQVYFGEEERQNRSSETRAEETTNNKYNSTDQGNSALSLTLLTDIWQTINQGNKETSYRYQRLPASPALPIGNPNLPRLKERVVPFNPKRQQLYPFRHQRKLFFSSAEDISSKEQEAKAEGSLNKSLQDAEETKTSDSQDPITTELKSDR